MNKQINIVTLDVPFPPDYGGAIDMYYSIQALYKAGFDIYLHCFTKKKITAALHSFCKEVHFYQRKKNLSPFLPYIVSSRKSKLLEERLLSNNYPILLHGLHTTHILHNKHFKDRKIAVRLHNIEQLYYEQLYKNSTGVKKIYYKTEANLIRQYENKILAGKQVLPISTTDVEWTKNNIDSVFSSWLPAFIPWQEVETKTGRGKYIVYHGNLSVAENKKAVEWLIKDVIRDSHPFVIAGKEAAKNISNIAAGAKNITIVSDPDKQKMDEVVSNAHIHALPSFNITGVKLKLLHALFCGRFIITNNNGVKGSGLESMVQVADSAVEFRSKIDQLMQQDFSENNVLERAWDLGNIYSNQKGAEIIIKSLA